MESETPMYKKIIERAYGVSYEDYWDERNGYRTIYHSDKEKIVDLFVGKSVKKVSEDTLELSDGTMVTLVGNEGCGGCPSGYYELSYLNETENIIMNVEIVDTEAECDRSWCEGRGSCYCENDVTYDIFVYHGNDKINLARFEGSDGNGYYGTGFWLRVVEPKTHSEGCENER